MMHLRGPWGRDLALLVILAFAALAQAWFYLNDWSRGRRLELGRPFPAKLASLHSRGSDVVGAERCWVAFLCDADCRACQRLARERAGQSEADSSAGLVWISAATRLGTMRFARDHGIWQAAVAVVERPERLTTVEVLRAFGVRGTPTRLILAPGGIVKDARIAHALPTDAELRSMCASMADRSTPSSAARPAMRASR